MAAPAGPWQKPAANTTCGDWLNQMNDEQRVDMAATLYHSTLIDMGADPEQLSAVVNDEMVPELRDKLSDACRNEAEVAALPGVMQRVVTAATQEILDNIADAVSP